METVFVDMAKMGNCHHESYGMFADSMQYSYDPLPYAAGEPHARLVSEYLNYHGDADLEQLLFPEDGSHEPATSQIILLGTDQQLGGSYSGVSYDSEESQEAMSLRNEAEMLDYFSAFDALKDIEVVPIVSDIDNIEKYINEASGHDVPMETIEILDDGLVKVEQPVREATKKVKKPKKNVSKIYNRCRPVYENSNFACDPCGRTFGRRSSLMQHNNVHHSGPREHRCDECGKRFHTLEELHRHVQRHVSLDKPHKCGHCTRQFNYLQDLERHIVVNHGVAKHQCRFCQKRIGRRDQLLAHEAAHAKNPNRFQGLALQQ